MFWRIEGFPRCLSHVFLSHCAGDRTDLVHPVYESLMRRSIIPWLDRDDYPYGRDSRTALRDGLLTSRHVVFFVTLAMMEYRRGWCPMELAYAELIQSNLIRRGGTLLNFELPLFFLPQDDSNLPRTAWNSLRDRGIFYHPADGDPAAWAVDQIVEFLRREQVVSMQMARVFLPGQPGHADLSACPGLLERVTRFEPGSIP